MAYASMRPIGPSAIVTYCQNFYFKIRRDHQKNSYERRDYESVDERAYLKLCPEKQRKKESRE